MYLQNRSEMRCPREGKARASLKRGSRQIANKADRDRVGRETLERVCVGGGQGV